MSDVGVGDWTTPRLDVTPYALSGATTATLTAMRPDGTSAAVTVDAGTVTTVDGAQALRFTGAATQLTQAGWWVLLWTVTGVGARSEPQRVFVAPNPAAGGPTWTPSRERVADYVPSRTLVPVAGANNAQQTFNDTTRPTGAQCDRLIADAVAQVHAAVGFNLHSSLNELATACAAILAAWSVEQGFPEREAITRENAIDTAAALLKRGQEMLTQLIAANITANGGDDPGVFEVAPMWSFPEPVNWGDSFL